MISMVGFLTFAAVVCTGLSWTLFAMDDPNHYTHDLIKVISVTLLSGLSLLCLYALYHWNSNMLLHFGWFLIAISIIFLYTEMVLERYEREELLPASIASTIVALIIIALLRKGWLSDVPSATSTAPSTAPVSDADLANQASEMKYDQYLKQGKPAEAFAYRRARKSFDEYLTKKNK